MTDEVAGVEFAGLENDVLVAVCQLVLSHIYKIESVCVRVCVFCLSVCFCSFARPQI